MPRDNPELGLLLVNLGTPSAPTTGAVRPYLREFLMDGRVIDMPAPLRWLLVNGIIAPFRSSKSAAAYREIWGDDGSPLLTISEALTSKVRQRLPAVQVELAMRYGEPSIASVLDKLAGLSRLVVLPLYPQYASATSGSIMEKVLKELATKQNIPAVSFVPPFYDHPAFLRSVRGAAQETLAHFAPDHVLFSFHGLPVSHLQKSHATCANDHWSCCASVTAANRYCYRAHCIATATAIAEDIEVPTTVAFQSRLGQKQWIEPYTDDVVVELAQKGVKRLAVFCPAFVADCLETLEEIGIRAHEDFVAAGGESLSLIPCCNATDTWADAVVELSELSPIALGEKG